MKKTKFSIKNKSNFRITNVFYEGESIETKVSRILLNKEPINDGAPLIYTNRKDGVLPGYDIRTDRFEVAIEAMDKVSKSKLSKRMEYINKDSLPNNKPASEPVQNTGDNSGDPSQ